jgi:transposase
MAMKHYAGLDVSLETTSICIVDEAGRIVAERKVATCPDAIAQELRAKSSGLVRAGIETGPLAVWLWGELKRRELPILCLDARHANAALKMMPNKTDRADARGLAQIVRTGWFRQAYVKSPESHTVRALLAARKQLVGMRCRLENEIRGTLRTFGVRFGKRTGGFTRRAGAILAEDLAELPAIRFTVEALLRGRAALLGEIRAFDARLRALARHHATCRRFMTVPGVGTITALAVYAAIDEPSRFRSSGTVGAYLGLTPRRYASGETDRSGRISRRGDGLTRTHLYEAANALLTRGTASSGLKDWGLRLARKAGFRKAKTAVARKLAVILHAMWKNGTEFRWQAAEA